MKSQGVVRAAGIVGFATLLSRILGYVRDMVIAYFFGTAASADAFFVAFRIPNLFRRLFAEGALTVAFIPIFTGYLVQESKESASRFVNAVFTLLSLILLLVSLLGIVFSPLIVKLMAWGFAADPDKFELTVLLTRIMFPYIFFVSLVALCMGILNALKHFAAPALSQVLLNLSMILSVVLLFRSFSQPVLTLAFGVLVGGFLQLALQVPFLTRRGVTLTWQFNFAHPGLKKLVKLMLPAALGAAVYQVNMMVITMIASFLPEGSVSYLYYSDRVFEFPVSVFGIALSTALLPALSEHVAKNEIEALKSTLTHALQLTFFITIPAMVGLGVLGLPIVRVLFERGAFTVEATALTAQALFCFNLGLWAVSGARVVVNVFYAFQDIWTPVKVTTLTIVVNLVLSVLLIKPLKHSGLALAISLSSMVNLTVLLVILRVRLGKLGLKKVIFSSVKILFSSLLMGVVVYGIYHARLWASFQFPARELVILLTSIVLGVIVFFTCAVLLKSEELFSLWEGVRGEKKDEKKR